MGAHRSEAVPVENPLSDYRVDTTDGTRNVLFRRGLRSRSSRNGQVGQLDKRFRTSSHEGARGYHLDVNSITLKEAERVLKDMGVWQNDDTIHELRLSNRGSGIDVLVSPKPAGRTRHT